MPGIKKKNKTGNPMKKAVFLDRDGTILKDRHYLSDPDRIAILPGVAKGIKLLRGNGFRIVVITNQSGIARGFFDMKKLYNIHKKLIGLLKRSGAIIDAIYFCPHLPSGIVKKYKIKCRCRKPDIKMALRAKKDLNINLKNSYMIGDNDIDMQFGRNFGSKGSVLVKTELDAAVKHNIIPDYSASNFTNAVKWILKKENPIKE